MANINFRPVFFFFLLHSIASIVDLELHLEINRFYLNIFSMSSGKNVFKINRQIHDIINFIFRSDQFSVEKRIVLSIYTQITCSRYSFNGLHTFVIAFYAFTQRPFPSMIIATCSGKLCKSKSSL